MTRHFSSRKLVYSVAAILLMLGGGLWYLSPGSTLVRAVKVTRPGSRRLPGPDRLFLFESREELLAEEGGLAAEVSPPVDFARENLVRIDWHADGPLFGTLEHRVRQGGSAIIFYVAAPTANYRTFSRLVSSDWFAVPKGPRVTFAAGL